MKKLLISSASVGVALALILIAIGINTEIFKPQTTKAIENKVQPNFVNSRETVNTIPIVKNKMLSANKNYTYLQGTIINDNKQTGIQSKVILSIKQPAYFNIEFTPDITQPDKVEKAVNDGDDIQIKDSKNNLKKAKSMKDMPEATAIEDDTVYPDYNGTYLPIGGVNEIIHPELLTQSIFRMGTLKVLGEEKFLNRDTTIIQDNLKESKVGNIKKFWVDNETGIILKSETYADDKLLESLSFENIDISTKIDNSKFQLFEK